MARSGGPTVGLDVGSSSIKVAELVPGRNGVTVKAIGMAPTPPGAVENNVIVDPQALGAAVKKLLKDAGVSARSSVSSVSGQSSLVVRVIEVPKMSEAELAETMKWEVERHVPFAANEVIMDFQAIERADTPPDAQNMEVLLAVAQQDMVDRHVEMLFAAGLKPRAVDVEPLAAARALIELGPDPYGKRAIAIVNIGASNTDIGIYQDGILAFPRTLPIGGNNLTQAIATYMGSSPEDAEAQKLEHGEVVSGAAYQPAPAPAADDFLQFPGGLAGGPSDAAPMPFDFSVPQDTGPAFGAPAASTDPGLAAPEAAPGEFDPSAPVAEPFGGFEVPGGQPAAPDFGAPGGFDLGDAPASAPAADAGLPVPTAPADPTKAAVSAAMASVVNELVAELRRSLEYYQGRAVDGVHEILLCGGTAKLKGLAEFLSVNLGVPTRVANPLEYTTVASRRFSTEHLNEIAPAFAVAVGLAARDMVIAKPPVVAGGKRKRK